LNFFRFGNGKEGMSMLDEKDPGIMQATKRLREISQDEQERIRAFEREKALLWDAMYLYHNEQKTKKIAEAAEARGEAKGEAKGIADTKRTTASRLLKKGHSSEEIVEVTELPLEEIERLREEQGT